MRDSKLELRLDTKFPKSKCRAASVHGGWIIEVVFPTLTPSNRAAVLRTVEREVRDHFGNAPQVFWKVFVYRSKVDRYLIDGTLHTLDKSRTAEGFPITTLTAGDTVVRLTEFDGELLMHGSYNGLILEMVEAVSTASGKPILPFYAHSLYRWLETQGGCYYLALDVPITIINSASPIELQATLK